VSSGSDAAPPRFPSPQPRHCEERSDAAIQRQRLLVARDWIASRHAALAAED